MIKNYPDQLGDWIKRRAKSRRHTNLAAFLAVRDDVRAALDQKYTVKDIWANLREGGRIPFGYDAFINYVNRFLGSHLAARKVAKERRRSGADTSAPKKDPDPTAVAKVQPPPASLPGFVFNPVPKKEELL